MLVLSRKPGERILVGPEIKITIVRIGPNSVRVGIDAPQDFNIRREEIDAEVLNAEAARLELQGAAHAGAVPL